jgi:tight adherence protein B
VGALLGMLLGCGLLLVWLAASDPRPPRRARAGGSVAVRTRLLLVRAGAAGVSLVSLSVLCTALGLLVAVVMAAVSGAAPVGVVFGLAAAYGPIALLRARARRLQRERAALWPDVVDDLASGVRAGMSLPDALSRVGERGPHGLRAAFVAFGQEYQTTGRFGVCLDHLKADLADPVGDRVVEALRVAREVGGGDLGPLLRALSGYLREDLRTRGELESRQAWTVNAARLAVGAPWVVLLLMSLQRDVVSRYASLGGSLVLLVGGGLCLLAYRLMVRIGRLPAERRVLA